MTMHTKRQYTLRNIPNEVDHVLRRRAKLTGKSFNQTAVEALAAGAGASPVPKRDFTFLLSSIGKAEAARIEAEIETQRRIDPELWK